LLSKAESLGALSLATDRNTPTALTITGLALLGVAAAVVVAVPDTDSTLLAAQAAGAVLLGGAGLAALAAGNVLGDLQRA
jgi:peptidoglycan/LPS O-acetylase OafA/YrhL